MTKYTFTFVAVMLTTMIAMTAWALPTVQIVTFEAPPFMSAGLPEQGAAVFAMKQTFLKAGYDLKVSFAPLKRAKVLPLESQDIVGYFPVSPYDLDKRYWASRVIFEEPWVIVERKDKPIHWQKFSDLKPYVGSACLQYTEPPGLRKLIDEKTITIEMSPDDISSLNKLGNKHVDYILIDPVVFNYITQTDSEMKSFAKDLQINPHPIEMLTYVAAFKKNSRMGKKLLEAFNNATNKEDFAKLVLKQLKK